MFIEDGVSAVQKNVLFSVATSKHGDKVKITGADGIVRDKLTLPGTVNGRDGVFEWIVEPDGLVNHRLFNTR